MKLSKNHNENIFFFSRYGDFGDHSAIKTTDQKVQQMKIIIEDQLKEASNQIISDETDSNEVLTHLSDSLATGNNFFKFSISRKKNIIIFGLHFFPGEEDIVFAQSKIKSRTTSLSKEAVRYEVGWILNSLYIFSLKNTWYCCPKH